MTIIFVAMQSDSLLYIRVRKSSERGRVRFVTYLMNHSGTQSAKHTEIYNTLNKSVRLWHCDERASPEAWREPPLGVVVGFSQKECMMKHTNGKIRQSSGDWLVVWLVCWLIVSSVGSTCSQPRQRLDLQLYVRYRIVLLTGPQRHSLDACS